MGQCTNPVTLKTRLSCVAATAGQVNEWDFPSTAASAICQLVEVGEVVNLLAGTFGFDVSTTPDTVWPFNSNLTLKSSVAVPLVVSGPVDHDTPPSTAHELGKVAVIVCSPEVPDAVIQLNVVESPSMALDSSPLACVHVIAENMPATTKRNKYV